MRRSRVDGSRRTGLVPPRSDPGIRQPMRGLRHVRVRMGDSPANELLVFRKDGVELLDVANSEQRLMKPEDLIQALAQLPASAWPYGRVVAVTQNGLTSPGDDVLIRKNRALVAGTLESMHVLINWVPSA